MTIIMADAAHREIWAQIPWVVAGSADAATREAVLAHLPGCEACRAEHEFQSQVRDGLVQGSVPASDPTAALQRFWQRVDAELEASPVPLPAAARVPPSRWPRALAAVVAVQAVALALLAGTLAQRRADQGYVTLSASAPRTAAVLRVVPAPEWRLADLQAWLAREGLRVVEVSEDARHFGLAPVDPATVIDAATLARLRAAPGLRLVEPLAR